MLLLIAVAAFEIALPWPIKWLVDSVFGTQVPSQLIAWLPGFEEGGAQVQAVTSIAILIVALGVLHKGLSMWSQFLFIGVGNRIVQGLRIRTLEYLNQLPMAYHDRSKVGDLIYRACFDTYALQTLLSQVMVPVFSGSCVAVGVVIVMLKIDIALTLVTVAAAPFFWMNLKRFKNRIEERSKRFHESESAISSQVQESLSLIRVIQAFTLESSSNARLTDQVGVSVRENMRKSITELGFLFVMGIVMSVATAAVVWLGARGVIEGRILIGEVLVFLAYLGTLCQPINAFSQGASAYHSAAAQLKRVFEVLDEPCTIEDTPDAIAPKSVQGALSFSGVSFAYEPDRPVLQNLNLEIKAGEVFALVGKTGSGKSTLAKLILRFYDPDHGTILLDGKDLRSLKMSWLRQQVSIVFQEPILFSATIAENIGFGKAGATREKIEASARRAQAHEFIMKLPERYDTLLGERGVNLSGGQRQRLSIARAFLKDAPVLILDEPTSAIDVETEKELLGAMRALMRGRTVLMIAHRLSTIREADRIGVISDGLLVEEGTHEQLLEARGAYWKLQEVQAADHGRGSL